MFCVRAKGGQMGDPQNSDMVLQDSSTKKQLKTTALKMSEVLQKFHSFNLLSFILEFLKWFYKEKFNRNPSTLHHSHIICIAGTSSVKSRSLLPCDFHIFDPLKKLGNINFI
jgi:hypothetical protein